MSEDGHFDDLSIERTYRVTERSGEKREDSEGSVELRNGWWSVNCVTRAGVYWKRTHDEHSDLSHLRIDTKLCTHLVDTNRERGRRQANKKSHCTEQQRLLRKRGRSAKRRTERFD